MSPRVGATVLILADDLIWASRLIEAVRRAGGRPVRLSSNVELETALEADALAEPSTEEPELGLAGVIVDMMGRRYDAASAVGRVKAAGKPVIAVAEHDDQVTRKRALDAGALRVFSYNKFFTDGTRLVEAWLLAGSEGATR